MRLSFVLACLAILHLPALPAGAQQQPAPAPGHLAVLGADGQPANGASVTVLLPGRGSVSPADEILVRSSAADNGVVEDAVPRLHGLTLVIDHPAHLPFVGRYPDQPPPSEIRLQAGRMSRGVVRESGSGRTVAGAEVCVAWSGPGLPDWFGTLRRCAESGARGSFELAGLLDGNVQATAEAPGFETDSRTIEEGRRASRVVFELVAREEASEEAVTAPAGAGEVRVELVGTAGEPIRNFTMRTNAVGRMGGSSHDVEDTEGPVLVPISTSFSGDATVDLSFRAENYLESPLIRVAPTPGGEIELGLIALDPGAVVQGRLFDAVGAEPAAGCLVELLPPGAGAVAALMLRQRHVTVSDAEGRYLLGGLRAGRYHLRQQCMGVPITDRLVVLGANQLADQGESWLRSGRRVAVRVAGIDGGMVRLLDRFKEVEAPIVQTTLQVPPEAEARQGAGDDSRVQAEFEAAPAIYRLEVLDASGRLRVSQEVAVEEGPAEVQTIDVAVTTRVIQSILVMDGRPVTGGHASFSNVFEPSRSSGKLQIVSQRPGGSRQQRVLGIPARAVGGAVGPDGAFEVEGAPIDLLWMTWRAEGGNVGRLWPEGRLPRMDLNGVRVTGQLLGADGTAVSGQVSLVGDIGRTVAYAEAGEDGSFVLPPAPPGAYRLKADAGVSPTLVQQGRSSRAGSVFRDLALGTEPPPHLVLRVEDAETGELEAELKRIDGSPAAGAWLHFVNASGDMVNTSLASAAGQTTRNLPAGDISLVWNDGAACTGGVGLNVEADRTATVRESLPMGRLLELRCPAAVDISFQADGYLRSQLIRVAPVPGGEVELGLIAMDRGAVVQGRLFDAVGAEPSVGCLVELLLAGGGPAIETARMREQHLAVSDVGGEYLLGGLEAGRYHLRVQCPDVPVADRFLVLGANELADQGESWLHPGRRVAVRVSGLGGGAVRLLDRFRESGAPIVEMPLKSSVEVGAGGRADDEASARAEFVAAPDTYRLEVLDQTGGLRVSQEIAIEEGPADVQMVNLGLPTRTIRSVLVLDGRPVSGGTVSFGRVLDPTRSSAKFMIVTQGGGGEHQRLFGFGGGSVRRLSADVAPDGSFVVEKAAAPTPLRCPACRGGPSDWREKNPPVRFVSHPSDCHSDHSSPCQGQPKMSHLWQVKMSHLRMGLGRQ